MKLQTKRHLSKLTLIVAVAAFAMAAPAMVFAQGMSPAKKMMGKCNEGERCTASCNSVKWCTVNVCTGGKWQPTMFGCAEAFCSHKKC